MVHEGIVIGYLPWWPRDFWRDKNGHSRHANVSNNPVYGGDGFFAWILKQMPGDIKRVTAGNCNNTLHRGRSKIERSRLEFCYASKSLFLVQIVRHQSISFQI